MPFLPCRLVFRPEPRQLYIDQSQDFDPRRLFDVTMRALLYPRPRLVVHTEYVSYTSTGYTQVACPSCVAPFGESVLQNRYLYHVPCTSIP